MTQRTFLLGLGASKSGTSWVQKYLNSAPIVDMGRLGEYQIWDALHVPANAKYRIARPPLIKRIEAALAFRLGLPVSAKMLRYRLQQDPRRYFKYFTRILAQPGITHTGDITPGYAALPTEVLTRIDTTFAAQGVVVKPILVLRDPIERAWSVFRMKRRKGHLNTSQSDLAAFLDSYATFQPGQTESYRATLITLAKVFPPERRYVGLFESLFTIPSIDALSSYCGIPSDPRQGATKVNASSDASDVPDETARLLFPRFADDYAYCADQLPETRTLWPHAHLLG